jgi:hypothetical protein
LLLINLHALLPLSGRRTVGDLTGVAFEGPGIAGYIGINCKVVGSLGADGFRKSTIGCEGTELCQALVLIAIIESGEGLSDAGATEQNISIQGIDCDTVKFACCGVFPGSVGCIGDFEGGEAAQGLVTVCFGKVFEGIAGLGLRIGLYKALALDKIPKGLLQGLV